MDFLVISGYETHLKSELRQNQLRQDMEKLHMKFSALNVDFDGPSLNFLGSRKPAHEGIKELYSGTPAKVVILPLLASL